MNEEENIKKMKAILDRAYDFTPPYLRGLLIPEEDLSSFHFLILHFIDMVKEAVKSRKQIWDTAQESQKAVDDFMVTLIEGIKEDTIKFGGDKE